MNVIKLSGQLRKCAKGNKGINYSQGQSKDLLTLHAYVMPQEGLYNNNQTVQFVNITFIF